MKQSSGTHSPIKGWGQPGVIFVLGSSAKVLSNRSSGLFKQHPEDELLSKKVYFSLR